VKPGRGRERTAQSLRREPDPASTFMSDFWPPDNERIDLCCFKPEVRGNLLQEAQETNSLKEHSDSQRKNNRGKRNFHSLDCTPWTALLAETAEEENLAELGLRSMKLFINCAVREKQSFGHYNPFCVS
jgi:hypothetical protein